MKYKSPLNIYVLWHPKFKGGQKIAEQIYCWYSKNITEPLSRGIGIPVFFRSVSYEHNEPIKIPFEDAENNAVILLVDNHAILNWRTYGEKILANIENLKQPTNHLLFPVSLVKNATKISSIINRNDYIRLHEISTPKKKMEFLKMQLTNELCRMLIDVSRISEIGKKENIPMSNEPINLFLSHAKKDGVQIAEEIKKYIDEKIAINTFFDRIDISSGHKFSDEILANIIMEQTSFIAIQTDAYASREWCRWEVLKAKKHDRPVIVINAVKEGEERSFPYLGNVPVIRWNHNKRNKEAFIKKILDNILYEILRFTYTKKHIQSSKKGLGLTKITGVRKDKILASPPELLTLLEKAVEDDTKGKLVIYPDPPLTTEEIELLSEVSEDFDYITPVMLPAYPRILQKEREKEDFEYHKFLENKSIGFSISESEDMSKLGYHKLAHLEDAKLEIARYLIAFGATLMYGGDLRNQGFTDLISQLVLSYKSKEVDGVLLQNYLAWPIINTLTEDEEVAKVDKVKFIKCEIPKGLPKNSKPESYTDPKTVEEFYGWKRSLTSMRKIMMEENFARIFLGGKLKDFKGKYPGVVEEAYLCIKAKKPVYLIGAFGGASQDIIHAILGKVPYRLTEKHQMKSKYQKRAHHFNENIGDLDEPISYPKVLSFFNKTGVKGLHNGLSEEDNKRLFAAKYIPEIASLILKGLFQLNT